MPHRIESPCSLGQSACVRLLSHEMIFSSIRPLSGGALVKPWHQANLLLPHDLVAVKLQGGNHPRFFLPVLHH